MLITQVTGCMLRAARSLTGRSPVVHGSTDHRTRLGFSREWTEDDFDVLAARRGCRLKVQAAPVGSPWMWTLGFGQHEDRTATSRRAKLRWPRSPKAGGANDGLLS